MFQFRDENRGKSIFQRYGTRHGDVRHVVYRSRKSKAEEGKKNHDPECTSVRTFKFPPHVVMSEHAGLASLLVFHFKTYRGYPYSRFSRGLAPRAVCPPNLYPPTLLYTSYLWLSLYRFIINFKL